MCALFNELMTTSDVRATMRKHIPGAEWQEATKLILSQAPHHKYYMPPSMVTPEPTYAIRIDEKQRTALFYAAELLARSPWMSLVLQEHETVEALRDMLMPPKASLPEVVQETIRRQRAHYVYPDGPEHPLEVEPAINSFIL